MKLSPEERAALDAACTAWVKANDDSYVHEAIWRAAVAYGMEHAARICVSLYKEDELRSQSQSDDYKCGYEDALCDAENHIRAQVQGDEG